MKVFSWFLFGFFFLVPFSSAVGIANKEECIAVTGYKCSTTALGCEGSSTKVGICEEGAFPDPDLPGSRIDSDCCKPGSTETPSTSVRANFSYTPLEEIPGQGRPEDFPAYVKAIYAFVLSAVGIAAFLMVLVGGFLYVTSAGNSGQVDKGKSFIKDALIGIVVAFGSYLVLYIINPDLVNINLDSLTKLKVTGDGADIGGYGDVGPGVPSAGGKPGEPGSCGGMNISKKYKVPLQCKLASAALSDMLTCMKGKGDTGTITSVTAQSIGDDFEKAKSCCGGSCPHATYTCHYGCKALGYPFPGEPGMSHAIDYALDFSKNSDDTVCAIADRAVSCRAGKNIWGGRNITCPGGANIVQKSGHGDHLHIPTSACGH